MKTVLPILLLLAGCANRRQSIQPPPHLRGEPMARVCWSINNSAVKCGQAIPLDTALAWLNKGNLKYGEGSHWLQRATYAKEAQ